MERNGPDSASVSERQLWEHAIRSNWLRVSASSAIVLSLELPQLSETRLDIGTAAQNAELVALGECRA